MLTQLVALAVIGYVGFHLVRSGHQTFTTSGSSVRTVLQAWRWWMVPAAIGLIVATILSYLVIATYAPWTRWGWFSLLGGVGNPALGSTTTSKGDALHPVFSVIQFLMPALLLVAIPLEALREEELFRSNSQNRSPLARFVHAVGFGLLHCVIGVPIAAGLAITAAGLGYTSAYLHAYRRWRRRIERVDLWVDSLEWVATYVAVKKAAALHATFNAILVLVLLTSLTLQAVLS